MEYIFVNRLNTQRLVNAALIRARTLTMLENQINYTLYISPLAIQLIIKVFPFYQVANSNFVCKNDERRKSHQNQCTCNPGNKGITCQSSEWNHCSILSRDFINHHKISVRKSSMK